MAESNNNEALGKIQQYATETRELRRRQMDVDDDAAGMEARLDQTLKELQARVQQQQAALEQLRARTRDSMSTAPSDEAREKLKQLIVLKDVYKQLTPRVPFLPTKDSVLPALLTARSLQDTINGTKAAVASTYSELEKTEALQRREEMTLRDANAIYAAMEARIERLQRQHAEKTQQTPEELARSMVEAHQAQKELYDEELALYSRAFDDFRTDYLAPMLAAEELGGPVVGSLLDVDSDTLAAGFTKSGTSKKNPVPDGKRQRRIDEIWGHRTQGEQPISEEEAASEELRELMEDLVTTMRTAGAGAYYQLKRDSAAARFLVRSKVAQFHPRDARRLRLIDFGRELDE